MAGSGKKEVIFEFHRVGNAVKVTAVDPVTLTEVSIVGSPAASDEMLKRTAISKLNYVLEKKRGGRGSNG